MSASAVLLYLLLVLSLPVRGESSTLWAHIDESWGGEWRGVDLEAFSLAQKMFRLVLAEPDSPMLGDLAGTLGFELIDVEDLVLIRETEEERFGRGVYVFRKHDYHPVILQAPHRKADRLTGKIAADWMTRSPVQVLAVNTIHRRAGPEESTADLARQKHSYFTALTRAAAEHYAHPAVVQIHGFAPDKRTTTAGRQADVILSSGRPDVVPPTLGVASCLMDQLENVRIYSFDVEELGGTVNPVSKWFAQRGLPGFLHLEISAPVRERLNTEPVFSSWFGACVLLGDKAS